MTLLSPKGRTAKQVAKSVIGLPFRVDNTTIGKITRSWVDLEGVIIEVSFDRIFANDLKLILLPGSEQVLPEVRQYRLEVWAWDRILDAKERLRGMDQTR